MITKHDIISQTVVAWDYLHACDEYVEDDVEPTAASAIVRALNMVYPEV